MYELTLFLIGISILIILVITLYAYACKNEKLVKELEEKQSLVNASRRSLAEAERKVSDRNRLIFDINNELKYTKNQLKKLKEAITSNNYGNAEIRLQKLKELARRGNQN